MQDTDTMMTKTSEPARKPRVHEVVEQINAAHDRLSQQVERLRDRLDSVLQPEQTDLAPTSPNEMRGEPRSPHALTLEEQAIRAQAIADRLSGLCDRLEI